jgi:hypothetical protein
METVCAAPKTIRASLGNVQITLETFLAAFKEWWMPTEAEVLSGFRTFFIGEVTTKNPRNKAAN